MLYFIEVRHNGKHARVKNQIPKLEQNIAHCMLLLLSATGIYSEFVLKTMSLFIHAALLGVILKVWLASFTRYSSEKINNCDRKSLKI